MEFRMIGSVEIHEGPSLPWKAVVIELFSTPCRFQPTASSSSDRFRVATLPSWVPAACRLLATVHAAGLIETARKQLSRDLLAEIRQATCGSTQLPTR